VPLSDEFPCAIVKKLGIWQGVPGHTLLPNFTIVGLGMWTFLV